MLQLIPSDKQLARLLKFPPVLFYVRKTPFDYIFTMPRSELVRLGDVGTLLHRTKLEGATILLDSSYLTTFLKGELVLGWYESCERDLLRKFLPRDEPVIELGASVGVISCITNRRLKNPQKHVVVEAIPELVAILKQNRDINRGKFSIVEAAIAYDTDLIPFFSNDASDAGSIYVKRGIVIPVRTRSLQSLAKEFQFDSFNLICDIEGSEIDLIRNELPFIRQRVKWLFIEMHPFVDGGEVAIAATKSALEASGFELIREDVKLQTHCYHNSRYSLAP